MNFLVLISLIFSPFQTDDKPQKDIYVASISWHTGIIVPAEVFPDSIWPGTNYSKFEYLEIGWGDKDFYQTVKFNPWYAFKAIFWPTNTALHVYPLADNTMSNHYFDTKVVKLQVEEKELLRLRDFILSHFKFDDQGKLINSAEGIYYNSRFFTGSSKYFFPKNSNVWAAMGLKRAGVPIFPILYQTTGMVLNRADNFGKVVIDD